MRSSGEIGECWPCSPVSFEVKNWHLELRKKELSNRHLLTIEKPDSSSRSRSIGFFVDFIFQLVRLTHFWISSAPSQQDFTWPVSWWSPDIFTLLYLLIRWQNQVLFSTLTLCGEWSHSFSTGKTCFFLLFLVSVFELQMSVDVLARTSWGKRFLKGNRAISLWQESHTHIIQHVKRKRDALHTQSNAENVSTNKNKRKQLECNSGITDDSNRKEKWMLIILKMFPTLVGKMNLINRGWTSTDEDSHWIECGCVCHRLVFNE